MNTPHLYMHRHLFLEDFCLKKYAVFKLAILFGFFIATNALANCAKGEQPVASCQVAGQAKKVSICLAGDNAVYRFGAVQGNAELVLRSPLITLGYLRKNGAKITIDETVIFPNDNYAYQVSFGFRDGLQPDPSALQKFGSIKVLHQNQTVTELTCAPETIQRTPELLFDKMRKLGRKQTSDGIVFDNYDIRYPGPVSQSAPCEEKYNVDSCWEYGVSAERSGDLALALGYFEKSCEAAFGIYGCYEAGRFYLQNRKLRNYANAYARLKRVCSSDDIGQGPYGCKYLGWMHYTGIGAEKDSDKAWSYLEKACFLHNEEPFIDAEGCHFFAKTISKIYPPGKTQPANKSYLVYLALAMGCTDRAEGLCEEAKSFLAKAKTISAAWVAQCDQDNESIPPLKNCAGFIMTDANSDASTFRQQILSHYKYYRRSEPENTDP
jgi:hypothetical protein